MRSGFNKFENILGAGAKGGWEREEPCTVKSGLKKCDMSGVVGIAGAL